jgi:hypothetical protein
MKTRKMFVLLVVCLLAGASAASASGIDAKAAFEKLKGLAGTWAGSTSEEGMQATVVFAVTANGSVVMETMFPGTPHEMINMYHMVGKDLVATHYCAAGNQPSFKLDAAASDADQLVFAFNGGSGFDPAKDMHIHSGKLSWKDNTLHAEWAAHAGGKAAMTNAFTLTRQ